MDYFIRTDKEKDAVKLFITTSTEHEIKTIIANTRNELYLRLNINEPIETSVYETLKTNYGEIIDCLQKHDSLDITEYDTRYKDFSLDTLLLICHEIKETYKNTDVVNERYNLNNKGRKYIIIASISSLFSGTLIGVGTKFMIDSNTCLQYQIAQKIMLGCGISSVSLGGAICVGCTGYIFWDKFCKKMKM